MDFLFFFFFFYLVFFLQHEANQNRLQLSNLEHQLRHLQEMSGATIGELRREMKETRNFVIQNQDDYSTHLVTTASRMAEAMTTAWQSLNAKMVIWMLMLILTSRLISFVLFFKTFVAYPLGVTILGSYHSRIMKVSFFCGR